MLGKGAVGKTSLIVRYVKNKFTKDHDPTVEDTYKVNITSKTGEKIEFQILDTAGEEDYQDMLDKWLSQASGFILVFAINDLESFNSLKLILQRIKKNEAENLPFIVVGNKCDLDVNRKVTVQQGNEFAKLLKTKYIETSALTDNNGNVKLAFEECAHLILNKSSGKGEKEGDGSCSSCFIV